MATRASTKNSSLGQNSESELLGSSNLIKSLFHAVEGLHEAIETQRNLRVHFSIALVVMIVSYFLDISAEEFLWLAFAVFSVIGMELINTMVEGLMNVYRTDHDARIKFVKDVAAGIVLWYSLFAVIIGLVVLGKSLFDWNFGVARTFVIIYLIAFPSLVISRRLIKGVKHKGQSSHRG